MITCVADKQLHVADKQPHVADQQPFAFCISPCVCTYVGI